MSGSGPTMGSVPQRLRAQQEESRRRKRRVTAFHVIIFLMTALVAYAATLDITPEFLRLMVYYYTLILLAALLFKDRIREFLVMRVGPDAVIFGLGNTGATLARNFLDAGHTVAIVERNPENPEIAMCRDRGMVVINGDALDWEVLARVKPWKARYLFAVTGDNGSNGEIALRANELVRQRAMSPVTCFVHLTDSTLVSLLAAREVGTVAGGPLRLEFFNIFQSAARMMIRRYPLHGDGGWRPRDHALIVGMGRMGESLACHLARDWQSRRGKPGQGFRITVIDRDAEQKRESVLLRNGILRTSADLHTLSVDLRSPDFLKILSRNAAGLEVPPDLVFICLSDESLGLSAALEIHHALKGRDVPIVIRTRHSSGLIDLVSCIEGTEGIYGNLHAFPVYDHTCSLDLVLEGTHERIAHAVHEQYLVYQRETGVGAGQMPALVPWEDLPEDLKEANRRQADDIVGKLEGIGYGITPMGDGEETPAFTGEEVESLAVREHDRWCRERREAGWTFGPIRDDVVKRHPDLVPWASLPETEREKDRNAVRTIPAVLARVDLAPRRIPGPRGS
ncbi:MAG: NAD-binding protein [Methanomicrobiales archaeon]|nr:NAD-binding protein [Methanomicrobiales archaeon]